MCSSTLNPPLQYYITRRVTLLPSCSLLPCSLLALSSLAPFLLSPPLLPPSSPFTHSLSRPHSTYLCNTVFSLLPFHATWLVGGIIVVFMPPLLFALPLSFFLSFPPSFPLSCPLSFFVSFPPTLLHPFPLSFLVSFPFFPLSFLPTFPVPFPPSLPFSPAQLDHNPPGRRHSSREGPVPGADDDAASLPTSQAVVMIALSPPPQLPDASEIPPFCAGKTRQHHRIATRILRAPRPLLRPLLWFNGLVPPFSPILFSPPSLFFPPSAILHTFLLSPALLPPPAPISPSLPHSHLLSTSSLFLILHPLSSSSSCPLSPPFSPNPPQFPPTLSSQQASPVSFPPPPPPLSFVLCPPLPPQLLPATNPAAPPPSPGPTIHSENLTNLKKFGSLKVHVPLWREAGGETGGQEGLGGLGRETHGTRRGGVRVKCSLAHSLLLEADHKKRRIHVPRMLSPPKTLIPPPLRPWQSPAPERRGDKSTDLPRRVSLSYDLFSPQESFLHLPLSGEGYSEGDAEGDVPATSFAPSCPSLSSPTNNP
ncbi:hypothetical protein C7M84_014720 [Penaeus vannamei]|uniref:Uncharacterized protein n=1 Tax=Penaeus vannamei TaxID=6689 RepID=A0A3R7M4U8_PENVA|nr:hypothetical protein C7M84_014720 [Penaeus vannamei]